MLAPIAKKVNDLTEEEIQQMYRLHLLYAIDSSPEAAREVIIERHAARMDVTYYLFKHEGRVVAFHAVTWLEQQTPFSKKKLPIFYVNMSFKDPKADALVKNYAKRTNLLLVRQHLGRLWFLRSFLITFTTINCKAIERLRHLLHTYYPNGNTPPKAIYDFAKAHLQHLNMNPDPLTPELVLKKTDSPWLDITQQWDANYQSKSKRLNQFFMEQGLYKKEATPTGDQYALKTDNFVLFIGYYNPWGLLRRRSRQSLRL